MNYDNILCDWAKIRGKSLVKALNRYEKKEVRKSLSFFRK